MFPIAVIAGLCWFAWRHHKRELSAAHHAVIDKAMGSTNAPAIEKVAVAFGHGGYPEVAGQLRQRAALVSRSPEELALHRQNFSRALAAPLAGAPPSFTRRIGEAFASRGMTHSGKFLQDYAKGWQRAWPIAPVSAAPPPPPDPTDPSTSDYSLGLPPQDMGPNYGAPIPEEPVVDAPTADDLSGGGDQ